MQNSDDHRNKISARETNQETGAEMSPLIARVAKLMGNKAVKLFLISTVSIGVGVGSFAQLNHMSHGSDSPKVFGEINPKITNVTVDKGGRFRYDPVVKGGEDNNIIQETDGQIKIETPGGVYEKEDKINGTFYGIKSEDIKKADPNFNDKGDNDDFIWVSSQKATTENIDIK